MQTSRPATRTVEVKTCAAGVKDLQPPLGPNHSLPVNSRPLGSSVVDFFLTKSATETNRYASHEIAT